MEKEEKLSDNNGLKKTVIDTMTDKEVRDIMTE